MGSKKKSNKKSNNRRFAGGPKSGGAPGFKHQKRLGQNFLTDMAIVNEIAARCGADEDTLVIEIGPGEGVLTDELAEYAGHVTAVELDDRLIPILRVRLFNRPNVDIVHGDILETDLNTLIRERLAQYGLSRTVIVGNLPYYITTPIIMKLLEENVPAESITVMVQKEVGERLTAAPGTKDAGAVTYTVAYYCRTERLINVGRECFDPVPKVDSMVIRLDRRDEPAVITDDPERMFRIIKTGFMMRRKTLLNALSALPAYDREGIEHGMEAAGIDPGRRAESLTLDEFSRLSEVLTLA